MKFNLCLLQLFIYFCQSDSSQNVPTHVSSTSNRTAVGKTTRYVNAYLKIYDFGKSQKSSMNVFKNEILRGDAPGSGRNERPLVYRNTCLRFQIYNTITTQIVTI